MPLPKAFGIARGWSIANNQVGPGDTTPDSFALPPTSNAGRSTTYISAIVTITGIDAPAPISVTGATVSVNGGPFGAAPETVVAGTQLRLTRQSSPDYSTAVSAVLNVGGVQATWVITTAAAPADSSPDPFNFVDVTEAELSHVYESNPITVSGINVATPISITGGEYSKNSGAWTNAAGTVVNGDVVMVHGTSAGAVSTAQHVTLTIGDQADTFTITTAATAPSAISLLEIASPAELDGTGAYGDATVRPGVNGNGWVAKVTVPYNAAATFDPSKITLNVQDPGFDANGATTVSRTVQGGAELRRQYGAQAQRQEANDGATLTIFFSLTDEIYQGTTVVSAYAAAGYYGAAQAGSIGNRVNGSTRPYPKPLAAFLNLQHERATGTSFPVEAVAYHRHAMNGRQVARVEFIAKDAQGTPNVAPVQAATSTSLSAFQSKGQIAEVFKASIPLTNLTQGDLCQVNMKVYPWLGDASAVLDLAVAGVAWPTANPQTPLRFLNDKTGGYGGAHVAVKAGAVGGTVQASYAAAVSTPFPTLNAAMAALPAWNQANRGHNDHSGSIVWLMEDGVGLGAIHSTAGSGVAANMNAVVAGQCWTDVRPDPAATGPVKVTMATGRTTANLLRWMVDIDHTAGNGLDAGATVNSVMSAYENLKLNLAGTTATVAICYRNGLTYMRNVEVLGSPGDAKAVPGGAAPGGYRQQLALMLGYVAEELTVTRQLMPFVLVGARTKRCSFAEHDYATNATLDSADGAIIANNRMLDVRVSSTWAQTQPVVRGLALVQNVLERAVVASVPTLQIGGDGMLQPMDNIVLQYNTVPGVDTTGRSNLAYTDAAGSEGLIKRISLRFNLLAEYNCKTDTFTGSPAGSLTSKGRVGNWPSRYGVGFEGNVIINGDSSNGGGGAGAGAVDASGGNWLGEFWPASNVLKAGAANVTFTNNKSGVAGAGGGTYTLTGGVNAAFSRVPAGRAGLSFDLMGAARLNDGSDAAGAYARNSGAAVVSWPYTFTNGGQVTGVGSSTMQGTGGGKGQVPPFTQAVADSSPTWSNKGAGGAGSPQVLTVVEGLTAGERAGAIIVQLAGHWAAVTNPENQVLADTASIEASIGHTRILHVPKHNDAIALAGSADWVRIRRYTREQSAATPGRVHDMALTYRKQPPADANDVIDQTNDVIPRSLQYDTAHANTAGNIVIAQCAYEPFVECLRGGVPYVPDQRVLSTNYVAAQTNGGLVCTVPYDAATLGALAGCSVAFEPAQPDFSVAIEGGAIVIRRASATLLTAGSYDLPLWVTKAGKRRRSWIKVFLTTLSPASALKSRNGNNWLCKEGPLAGVTNTGKKFMAVFGLRCLSGAATTRRLVQFGNSAGINIEIKSSNRTGFVIKNGAGATVVNLDGGTGGSLIGADADIRWVFMAADTTTGVQIAKSAVDALAAVTNVPTADADLNIAPVSATALQRLFSSTDAGASLCDLEIAAIWMAEGYMDIGPTAGNRDLFRDPATKASLIPADGVVGGIAPFFYMAGPAGNLAAGINLAQPADRWEATDRNPWTTA